jgi:cytochrome c5
VWHLFCILNFCNVVNFVYYLDPAANVVVEQQQPQPQQQQQPAEQGAVMVAAELVPEQLVEIVKEAASSGSGQKNNQMCDACALVNLQQQQKPDDTDSFTPRVRSDKKSITVLLGMYI